MANEIDDVGTPIEDEEEGVLDDVLAAMAALGPKSVEGKEFKAENFDPLKVQRLLERTAGHPTFASLARTRVISKRAEEDCLGDGGSCGCH